MKFFVWSKFLYKIQLTVRNCFVGSPSPTAYSEFRTNINPHSNRQDQICFQSNFLHRTSVQLPHCSNEEGRGQQGQKISIEKLQFYSIGLVCKPRGASGGSLPRDKASPPQKKDSSKRKRKKKSNISLLKTEDKLSGDLLSGEALPRQRCLQNDSPARLKPHITPSTFTIRNVTPK